MSTRPLWQTAVAAALAAVLTQAVLPAGAHPARERRAGAGARRAAAAAPRFDYEPPAPGTYRLPPLKPAADGRVLDTTGAGRRLHDVMGGRIVVLSFVYTRCADATGCPLATAVLHQARAAVARDPALAGRLTFVTLSFDPEHDTPAVLASYAGPLQRAPGPRWEFVVPDSAPQLERLLDSYGQTVERDAGGQATGHLLRVFLIDAERRIRNIYGLDFLDPRLLLSDIRTLLLEERGGRP